MDLSPGIDAGNSRWPWVVFELSQVWHDMSCSVKTYLINLDKNVERLDFMKKQLGGFGMEFERIPAVNGRELTEAQWKRDYAEFRSQIALGWSLRSIPGMMGCILSHQVIYRKIIESGEDLALVFEDDASLTPEFPDVLAGAIKDIKVDRPQMVIFNCYVFDKDEQKVERGLVRAKSGMGTEAYLITRKAAELILKVNYPVVVTPDCFSRWVRWHGLELFRAYPTTVRQENETFGTDIASWNDPDKMVKGPPKKNFRWLKRKCKRACQRGLDWLIWKMTGV